MPRSLRLAVTAGVGLFLAVIALKNAGLVVGNPATLVALGPLGAPGPALAALGFVLTAGMVARKMRGALLAGILFVTLLSFAAGHGHFAGVVSLPPSVAPTFLALDIGGALHAGLLNVVLALFLVELFDATGTLVGVASRAGLLRDGPDQRLDRALLADSTAILAGSLLGTSSATAYLESAAGVGEGGRTGLVALVVAGLFLLCLFFAPLAGAVPAYATAPALLLVACLMLRDLGTIAWDDVTEALPAAVTAITMPFTFSIANGVAFGFITYCVVKLLAGRAREVGTVPWIVAAAFGLKFALAGGG